MKHIIKVQLTRKYLFIVIETPSEKHNYFSITGELWEAIKGRPLDNEDYKEISGKWYKITTSGCIHEIILKYKPSLKMFVDLHLSNETGLPMSCAENGFYFYQKLKGTYQTFTYTEIEPAESAYFSVLCEHLRISTDECNKLIEILDANNKMSEKKLFFYNYVLNQLPRYKKEAEFANEKIQELINQFA
jgi:hypothetical protein